LARKIFGEGACLLPALSGAKKIKNIFCFAVKPNIGIKLIHQKQIYHKPVGVNVSFVVGNKNHEK